MKKNLSLCLPVLLTTRYLHLCIYHTLSLSPSLPLSLTPSLLLSLSLTHTHILTPCHPALLKAR